MKKKRDERVCDDELFIRLLYYGLSQLHLSRQDEVWFIPFGLFLIYGNAIDSITAFRNQK